MSRTEGFSYTATTRPCCAPGEVRTKEQCERLSAWPTRRTRVWKISSARSAAETSWKMSKRRSRARSVARRSRSSSRCISRCSRRDRSSSPFTGVSDRVVGPGLDQVGDRPFAATRDDRDQRQLRPLLRHLPHLLDRGEVGRVRARHADQNGVRRLAIDGRLQVAALRGQVHAEPGLLECGRQSGGARGRLAGDQEMGAEDVVHGPSFTSLRREPIRRAGQPQAIRRPGTVPHAR